MFSTDFLQVDWQDLLSTGSLHVVSISCNNSANDNEAGCNLMKLTSLLQLVNKLQQSGKIDSLLIILSR